MSDRPVLTIDPKRGFGRVCVGGTGISAEAIAERVIGDGVERVMEDYGITREMVLLCCLWFVWECAKGRRKLQRQVAKAWDSWAFETALRLGGHHPGPLSDPPDLEDS